MARWGMPTPQNIQFEAAKKRVAKLGAKGGAVDFEALLAAEPDRGFTNTSQHIVTALAALART